MKTASRELLNSKIVRSMQNKTETPKYDTFYSSWSWKKLRFNILKKYGAICMLCGSKEKVVVDHSKPTK